MTLHHEVRGDGSAVLLVHAGIADARMWGPLAERLVAAGYRTIAPDLPGFGRTPLEPGVVSNPGALVALLDELGLDRVPVVAASFGGLVSLDLALRAPGRVAGLVLLGSDLDESAESDELAAFAAEEEAALDAGDVTAAVEANVRMWVTRGDRDVDPAVVELVAAMQRAAFEAQMGVDAELEEPDPPVARRLGEIGVPALVIVGADDVEDFVRLGERLADELPGSGPLVRIAGAAHLPALERPDEVAALVLEFLAVAQPTAY